MKSLKLILKSPLKFSLMPKTSMTWKPVEIYVFEISISTPKSFKLCLDDQCVVVQDVSSEKNAVLFLKSSPLNTPSLWMGVLNENQELSAKCVIDGFDLKENNEFNVETLIHTPKLEHENPLYKNVKYSSIYTGTNVWTMSFGEIIERWNWHWKL